MKTAPNSKESEMMVLGSILNSKKSIGVACSMLEKNDFFFTEHKIIFSTLQDLYSNSRSVDLHIICEELRNGNQLESVGGPAYLTTLAQYAGTSANIDEYCSEILKKSHCRKSLRIHEEAIEEFLKDPSNPFSISENIQKKFIELGKRFSPKDKASLGEILSGKKASTDSKPMLEKIKERQNYFKEYGKPCLQGIPTGFCDVDRQTSILKESSLIVIAGRPSMGKTAFVLNLAANIACDQNLPVGLFSLEMGRDQLVERIISLRTGICGTKIEHGNLSNTEYDRIEKEESSLCKSPIFIHDQAISYVSQVVDRARRLKDEEDIQLLIVDYLQLLGTNSRSDSRQYEVAEVSRSLKMLAMEMNIPIICVAQLSRKVEERTDKRPLMSDLRDSGQIEQDADAILFLFRKSYYEQNVGESEKKAEVIIAKNRHGPTGSIELSFIKECGSFNNLLSENKSNQIHQTVRF